MIMILISTVRSLIAAPFFVVSTLFFSSMGLLVNFLFGNRALNDFIASTWAASACWLFNVKIELHGKENIPDGATIYLFNHSSFFDVFAISALIPQCRFGAKIELFSIPVFGAAIRKFGVLPIERRNKEAVFKVYEKAAEKFTNGAQFVLSPEGGRHYSDQLSKFKAGPFIFAISAGVPLTPLIVVGAYEVLPKKGWLPNWDRWSRKIDVYVLKPTPTNNATLEDRSVLQEIIYSQMNDVWFSKRLQYSKNSYK